MTPRVTSTRYDCRTDWPWAVTLPIGRHLRHCATIETAYHTACWRASLPAGEPAAPIGGGRST